MKKEYSVTGMHTQGKKTHIRFLSDICVEGAESCEPNIEDAYMLYLWRNGASMDFSGGNE